MSSSTTFHVLLQSGANQQSCLPEEHFAITFSAWKNSTREPYTLSLVQHILCSLDKDAFANWRQVPFDAFVPYQEIPSVISEQLCVLLNESCIVLTGGQQK